MPVVLVVVLISFFSLPSYGLFCRDVFSSPQKITKPSLRRIWTVEDVVAGIRALHAAGLPINSNALQKGGKDYDRVLEEAVGEGVTASKLFHAKPEKGWKWSIALERAGFNSADHKKVEHHKWTVQDVIVGIKALYEEGLSINIVAVRDGGVEYQNVLLKALGVKVTGAALAQARPEKNWSWDVALETAGFRVSDHKILRTWTVEDVVLGIQALHKAGLPLHYGALRQGGKEYEEVLGQLFGKNITPRALTRAKPEEVWTWDIALQRAGFNHLDHRVLTLLTAQEVVSGIHALHQEGLALNFQAVTRGGDNYNRVLQKAVGQQVSSSILIRARPEEGWDWNVALVRAGLNPNEVRLRGSAPFHLLTKAMQEELSSNYEALTGDLSVRLTSKDGEFEAATERTAEDVYREVEISEKVNDVVEGFSSREQVVFEKLLDYFDTHKEFNLEVMVHFFAEKGENISQAEIVGFINKIKEDSQLRALILG